MTRIQVLPQNLINQIAAGEVVVNMASAIKELVENSIDAGAVHVTVELSSDLRDAGVADDGHGMDRDDAELCLQRHATSKIRNSADLFNLRTRGFRGEALPSIASVCRMEIVTRAAGQLAGTRLVVEGGAIEKIEATGCPPGTRITLRDLFYNTPARRKFLKSPVGEYNDVMRTLVRQALASPAIGMRVVRGEETLMELPAGQTLADRFLAIAGDRITTGLLDASYVRDDIRVCGHLAQPLSNRGDRRSQYLFVNGRPFTSKSIGAAVEQAFRGFIMVGRFPIFCLFVDVPPDAVDINVHPTKEEVRFTNERAIAGACYHAAREALERSGFVPDIQLEAGTSGAPNETPQGRDTRHAPPSVPPPAHQPLPGYFTSPEALVARAFERKSARLAQEDWVGLAIEREHLQPVAPEYAPALGPSLPALPDPSPRQVAAPARNHAAGERPSAGPGEQPDASAWRQPYEPEPLGQIAATYIVARFGEDLLLIDQHAAHERLRFIELCSRARSSASQSLLTPILFRPPPDRLEVLRALIPALQASGYDIAEFGGHDRAIHAVPADLADADHVGLLGDLLDEFDESPRVDRLEDLRERILIRAACHSAIRAGQTLAMEEMRELLRLMRRHQLSFTCPHGRPTILRLAKAELDRQFRRTV